ncbi:MAG: sulfatase-like hydrolase/transferase, partial [Myxococcota bacterium]
ANWREDQPWELPPAQLTLAELGRLSPYYEVQSSYAGKWHLGTEVAESGYGHPGVQGWGWYAGAFANLYTIQDKYLSYFDWDKVVDGAVVDTTTYATTDTFDDAVARVGVMAEPWMLMVSTNATHLPLEAPPAELVPVDPPAGDGYTTRQMLEGIDTELARLLAAIPPEVLARTTIVLTTDNGTHRAEASDWVDPNRAKGTLFDGGVHVPLIVSGPAVAVPGSRSAAFVDLVDVFPTVAEWMGVDVGAVPAVLDATRPYAIDGVSLTPLLQDPTSAGRAFVYSELFGPPGPGPYTEVDRQMIRDEQYKLIVDNNSGKVMFFDYAGTRFEGPDLVVCGMDADQAAAYERLTLTLAGYTAELVYDAAPYPPEVADTGVDPDFPIDHDTGVQVCP